jgi:hypothetical protein
MFSTYFELGLRHIGDFDAYDHMVFILALISTYRLIDLKKIFWLVTAFTLGHSLTLALSTLNIISVNSAYVEFLIPVTIFITAMSSLLDQKKGSQSRMGWRYFLAMFFGLIHGLGFSGYLKAILGKGDVVIPLLAFNLGVEAGQLIIVAAILLFSALLFQIFRFKHRDWVLVISGVSAGISLVLMKETVFW